MTELILLLLVGILLAAVFTLVLLMGSRSRDEEPQAAGTLLEVVSLPGLGFKQAAILFDDSDYRILQGVPALKNTAWHLRRDRRRLALLWLKLLRRDLSLLWRFRRLLTSYGVSASPVEELRVATTAIMGHVMLSGLSVLIMVSGPFVLSALSRNPRLHVEKLSRSCAWLLGRIPPARWSEIQIAWTARLPS